MTNRITDKLIELNDVSYILYGRSSKVIKIKNDIQVDLEILLDCVCEVFGVTIAQLASKSRVADFVYPRHIFSYIAVNEGLGTLKNIASFVGDRDHTTIMHSHKVAAPSILQMPDVKDKYNELIKQYQETTYFMNYGRY